MTVFTEILNRYGEKAVLQESGRERTVRVFIQPIINHGSDKTWKDMTLLGERNLNRYYCFGPSEKTAPNTGSVVLCGDRKYEVVRGEQFKVNGGISHWEAVLRIMEDEYDGGI